MKDLSSIVINKSKTDALQECVFSCPYSNSGGYLSLILFSNASEVNSIKKANDLIWTLSCSGNGFITDINRLAKVSYAEPVCGRYHTVHCLKQF